MKTNITIKKYIKLRKSALLIITLIVILISILGIISYCRIKTKTKDVIFGVGTIIYLSFEGGFYGIETTKGEEYLPLNLPDGFKIDGLKVIFTAKIIHGVFTTYMWGIPVELLKIEII